MLAWLRNQETEPLGGLSILLLGRVPSLTPWPASTRGIFRGSDDGTVMTLIGDPLGWMARRVATRLLAMEEQRGLSAVHITVLILEKEGLRLRSGELPAGGRCTEAWEHSFT